MSSNKAIFEVQNFLTFEECERILAKRVDKSFRDGVLKDYLVFEDESSGCDTWQEEFDLLNSKIPSLLEEYSKGLLGLLPLEKVSISHIGFLNDEFGEFTELHYDWELVKVKEREIIPKPFVILLYLTEVEEGGDLLFPIQNIKISPKKGKAVIFPCNYSYPHSAMPVMKGSKHICRVTMKIDPTTYEVDTLEI